MKNIDIGIIAEIMLDITFDNLYYDDDFDRVTDDGLDKLSAIYGLVDDEQRGYLYLAYTGLMREAGINYDIDQFSSYKLVG